MNMRTVSWGILALGVCLGVVLAAQRPLTRAQGAATGYELVRAAIAPGGADVQAGAWSLSGAVGQKEAFAASSGSWSLTGGMWVQSALPQSARVSLPLLLRK